MASRTLVISNPPHGAVSAPKAAPVLGLIPVEVNLKMHYPIPEIWVAEEDPEEGIRAAETLMDAGASVVVTNGDALAAVPAQRLIHKFAFTQTGMRVLATQGAAEIPYAHPVIAVYCAPRPMEGAGSSDKVDVDGTHASESAAFLDLYLKASAGVTRLSLFTDLLDYSGLGERRVPSHARNMAQLMEQMTERFTGLRVDRRLVNMQLRRRVGVGTPVKRDDTRRRGYSFASPGWQDLLNVVAPPLVGLGQADWSSRLIYLTLRRG